MRACAALRQGGKPAMAAGCHARQQKGAGWLAACPGAETLGFMPAAGGVHPGQVERQRGGAAGGGQGAGQRPVLHGAGLGLGAAGLGGGAVQLSAAQDAKSCMPPAAPLLLSLLLATTHSMRALPSCLPVQIDTSDVGGATPYVVQQYTAGDSCELTGRPREAEVRFTCGSSPDTLMVSVREPSSCTYTVTIATPRLCKHPAFQQQPPPAALIQCHALPEEGGGTEAVGVGSCAAADSGQEHGSCAADASVPAAADAAGAAAAQAAASGKEESGAAAGEDDGEHANVEDESEEDEYADAEDEAAGPAAADDDDPYL